MTLKRNVLNDQNVNHFDETRDEENAICVPRVLLSVMQGTGLQFAKTKKMRSTRLAMNFPSDRSALLEQSGPYACWCTDCSVDEEMSSPPSRLKISLARSVSVELSE